MEVPSPHDREGLAWRLDFPPGRSSTVGLCSPKPWLWTRGEKRKDGQIQEQGLSLRPQRQPQEEGNVVLAPTVLYMHEAHTFLSVTTFFFKYMPIVILIILMLEYFTFLFHFLWTFWRLLFPPLFVAHRGKCEKKASTFEPNLGFWQHLVTLCWHLAQFTVPSLSAIVARFHKSCNYKTDETLWFT